METMFDRLGDLLNKCLETGEFPEPKAEQKSPENDVNPNENPIPKEFIKDFALLGFNQNAEMPALNEVHSAYAKLIKEIHPDTSQDNIDSSFASEKITEISSAYKRIKTLYK